MKKLMVLLFGLATAASVAASDFELPPGKWWESERLATHIGLSDRQASEIREVVFAHARRMIDLKAKVELAGLDLAETVNHPQLDGDAVRAAYASFQAARQALENERFDMLLAVRQVLTFEQWQQLQELKRRTGDGRGQRRPVGRGRAGEPGQQPPGQRF